MSHHGPEVERSGEHRVIDCADCGWVHLDPIPTTAEVTALYRTDYHDPPNVEKEWSERGYWRIEHAWKLDTVAELAGGTGRILDVGCAIGLFLEHASSTGWEAMGIEPSEEAAAHATGRGLQVIEGTWESVDPESLGRFDVVHCKLVLEHLRDPLAFVTWVRCLLVPGGVFCAQAPNEFNPLQRLVRTALGKGPWWVAPPFHINYFTFDTLEHLLCTAGLEPVLRQATFPMELFPLLGFDYVGDDTVGRDMHRRRMELELLLDREGYEESRRRLYSDMAAGGVGREAIVYAKAPPG